VMRADAQFVSSSAVTPLGFLWGTSGEAEPALGASSAVRRRRRRSA
jgi:hypothetical protein